MVRLDRKGLNGSRINFQFGWLIGSICWRDLRKGQAFPTEEPWFSPNVAIAFRGLEAKPTLDYSKIFLTNVLVIVSLAK